MKYGSFIKNPTGKRTPLEGVSIPHEMLFAESENPEKEKIEREIEKLRREINHKVKELDARKPVSRRILTELRMKLYALEAELLSIKYSKNPQKFWVMDTDVRPWTVKHESVSESMAQRIVDRLNTKAGRERYQVLGFGVGNPLDNGNANVPTKQPTIAKLRKLNDATMVKRERAYWAMVKAGGDNMSEGIQQLMQRLGPSNRFVKAYKKLESERSDLQYEINRRGY